MTTNYIKRGFGCRQVEPWYSSSHSVICDFESIGRKLPLLSIIPTPFPLYDWIMGFYERWSNRRLLAMAPLESAKQILELGTGTGFLLGELIRRTTGDQDVTAIDLSTQMLSATEHYLMEKGLTTDRVHLENTDCMHMPYADDSFDLCVSSYLLDLLNDDEVSWTLTELDRVLKPGGEALLLTMTTEFHGATLLRNMVGRISNELYCLGYHKGRWNCIWSRLFSGYAPHCRPISLGCHLAADPSFSIVSTRITHVLSLPTRIYHVRKSRA